MSVPFHRRKVDIGMAMIVLLGVPIIAAFLFFLTFVSTHEEIDNNAAGMLFQKLRSRGEQSGQRVSGAGAVPWAIGLGSGEEVLLGPGGRGTLLRRTVSRYGQSREVARLELDEPWTRVSARRGVFYADPMGKFLFVPGRSAHAIVSTARGSLRLVRTIAPLNLRRVLAMQRVLLLIGRNTLTAYSTTTWRYLGSTNF